MARNLGTISAGGFISGATFTATNGYSGPYFARIGGNFYGPSAEEIGGVFALSGMPGSILSGGGGGVFVGKGN